jgi:hypothetical protein
MEVHGNEMLIQPMPLLAWNETGVSTMARHKKGHKIEASEIENENETPTLVKW